MVKDTVFYTEVDLSFGIPEIYYHVVALDYNYNNSEPSDHIALIRPDLIPPSRPLLSHVIPTKQGMRIAWRLSQDRDVKIHYLQRKLAGATAWSSVVAIADTADFPPLPLAPGEIRPSNYIDSTSLLRTTYQYRLYVTDHSGNVSLSDIITVQPFDDGMRGKIGYLRGVQLPGSSSAASLYTQQGLINPFIPNGNTNIDAFRIIELRWYYQTEFLSSLMEFKIYFRFTQNSPGAPGDPDPRGWQLVKTLSVADALEMAGAMHFDGYAFVHDLGIRANEVSLQNTEYRIVAYHKDGGSSLPATVIVGNLGGN